MGITIVMIAAGEGNPEMVRFLVNEKGAAIEDRDEVATAAPLYRIKHTNAPCDARAARMGSRSIHSRDATLFFYLTEGLRKQSYVTNYKLPAKRLASPLSCLRESRRLLSIGVCGAALMRKSQWRHSPPRAWPSRDPFASRPQDGRNVLMYAASGEHDYLERECLEVVQFLVNEKGVDVNAKDKVRHTHTIRPSVKLSQVSREILLETASATRTLGLGSSIGLKRMR